MPPYNDIHQHTKKTKKQSSPKFDSETFRTLSRPFGAVLSVDPPLHGGACDNLPLRSHIALGPSNSQQRHIGPAHTHCVFSSRSQN